MGESNNPSKESVYRAKMKAEAEKKDSGKKALGSKPQLKPHKAPTRRDNGGNVR